MRAIQLLFATALLLLSAAACAGPAARDADALEGTWVPTAIELGGQPFPADGSGSIELTIANGRYLVNVNGQLDRGELRLAPAERPKAMDIVGTEGPNQGRTYFAIYELMGDKLRICYDLGGNARPSDFKTHPDTQHLLVEYRRAPL